MRQAVIAGPRMDRTFFNRQTVQVVVFGRVCNFVCLFVCYSYRHDTFRVLLDRHAKVSQTGYAY